MPLKSTIDVNSTTADFLLYNVRLANSNSRKIHSRFYNFSQLTPEVTPLSSVHSDIIFVLIICITDSVNSKRGPTPSDTFCKKISYIKCNMWKIIIEIMSSCKVLFVGHGPFLVLFCQKVKLTFGITLGLPSTVRR